MGMFLLSGSVDPILPVTTDMLQPVIDAVVSNLAVILPIGIALFGILIGISLIPKIIKLFIGK